jgi:hypothetical protein
VLFPPILLVVMLVLATISTRTGRVGAVLLAAVSALWLLRNQAFEGQILWVVTPTHALTAGDLPGIAGVLVAVWCFFGRPGDRRDR